MNRLLIILLSVFFIITPYQRGLFFDDDFYIYEFLINLLLTVILIFFWINKKLEDANWKILIVYLIPLTYIFSLGVAETPLGAFNQILRWTTYCSFFILTWWAGQSEKTGKYFIYTLALTGLWITSFTLLGIYEKTDFRDIVLYGRPSGVFQYPNTFAAVVGSLWLFHTILLTRKNIPRLEIIFLSIPLVLYGVMFIGSLSRGTWLLLPFVWLIGILFLRLQQQLKLIYITFISIGFSFLTYRPIVVEKSSMGIMYLLAGSILVIILVLVYDKVEQKDIFRRIRNYSTKRFASLLIPVVILLSGLLLVADLASQGLVYQQLPTALQKRIDTINSGETSVQGRMAFYKDAMEMNKDYPLLGLGGDGWRVLFTKYQDVPYWSNEVHNGYLEWLLSVGWLGVIIISIVFIYLFYQLGIHLIKLKEDNEKITIIAVLMALMMLMLHSALDFNFSYGTIWIMVMWLLAIALPNKLYPVKLLPNLTGKYNHWVKRIIFLIVIIIVGFSVVHSFRFYMANNEIAKIKGRNHAKVITEQLEKASAYNPYRTDILLKNAEVYGALFTNTKEQRHWDKAVELLKKAEELEPNNAKVMYSIAQIYLNAENQLEALKYLEKTLHTDHFNTAYYETIMKTNIELAYSSISKKETEATINYAKTVIQHYQNMKKLDQEVKGSKLNQRRFGITPQSRYLAGQAYYLLGDDTNVITELTPIKNDKDPNMKKRVNAYLALSYQRINNMKKYEEIVRAMKKEFADFEKLLEEMEQLNEWQ